jgi:peptidoglycan/xylan/chitin deacetylase (PgdA/CDA1 family)
MITVLMYHAIPARPGPQPGADAHYSVALDDFGRQLQRMLALGLQPSSVARLLADLPSHGAAGRVGITFDDGHMSNHEAAARLRDLGGTADFFINPSTVGSAGFLSWEQLREMVSWGMSIQSHGMNHHFLDDLDVAGVQAELADSKAAIEQQLGRRVTLFAPPGGRVVPGLAALARQLGYERICSSRVALWDDAAELAQALTGAPGAAAPARAMRTGGEVLIDIPRLAMLAGTGDAQLLRWLQQSRLEMAWQTGRHTLLRSAKKALGNQAYVLLRGRLLRPATGGQP